MESAKGGRRSLPSQRVTMASAATAIVRGRRWRLTSASSSVRWGGAGVLPSIDVDAVERTDCGEENDDRKQRYPQSWRAGDRREEDRGGEEDADGELLRETQPFAFRKRLDVNEQQPYREKSAEHGIEAQCARIEARQQHSQQSRGRCHAGEKAAAMTVMEAVAGFQNGYIFSCQCSSLPVTRQEDAGVQQAVGDVDHPDGEEHGCRCGPGQR